MQVSRDRGQRRADLVRELGSKLAEGGQSNLGCVLLAQVIEQPVELTERHVLARQILGREIDFLRQAQVELADFAIGIGKLVEHLVETLGQPSDFVRRTEDDSAVEVAALDVAHGCG